MLTSLIKLINVDGYLKSHCFINVLLLSNVIQALYGEDPIASKQHHKEFERIKNRCPYGLRKLWQADVSSFPFASAPLISDINGDGRLDIVAAPFGETLTVLEGDTGKHLPNSAWPQHNLDKSIHSSPIQYDIDGDNILDLLFVTSKGELLFYSAGGLPLHSYTFQLDPAYVKPNWFESMNTSDYNSIGQHVSQIMSTGSIPVDVHVLDTPVLHDMRYLVISISYFYSDDDYGDDMTGPWGTRAETRDKYYVAAVAILDLKGLKNTKHENKHDGTSSGETAGFTRVVFLELHQSPVVNLFSPTVVDVDGDFSEAEIVVGTSSGQVYVLNWNGKFRKGFPQSFGPTSGLVTAANLISSTTSMELVVTDKTGHVTCVDATSSVRIWSAEVTGGITAGSRVVDVDTDGQLDVVVTTSDGSIYALNGASGDVIPKYPYKTSRGITGGVLVSKFHLIRKPYDLVFLSDDGILHILASDLSCESQVTLTDTSFVALLLHDLSPHASQGPEVLVATADGSLVCLGSGQRTPVEEIVSEEAQITMQRLVSQSAVFSMEKAVIRLEEWVRSMTEATGSSLDIYFTIHKGGGGEVFSLKVYVGSELVHQEGNVENSLGIQVVTVRTPEVPGEGLVTIVIQDRTGYVSKDSIHLRFNQLILLDLQWLVLSPFIAMIIILLVNHGFPAKDLLPMTFPFKSK